MTDQSWIKCKLSAEDSEFGKKLVFDINDYENQSKRIVSEVFRIDSNIEFRLWLNPKHKSSDGTKWLSVFLVRYKSERNAKSLVIQYKIFIIDSNGQRKHKCDTVHEYGNKVESWGYDKYVTRNVILNPQNLLLAGKTLRIGFEIKLMFETTGTMLSIDREKTEKMMQNSNLSDVKFIVKGKTFLLHKFILSGKSEVFEAMFRNDVKEQNTSEVIIDDIDSDVFKIFIEFLYLHKINGFESNAEQLLYCAEKYDISELKYICENTIANGIDSKNAVKVLILSDIYHSEYLEKKSIEFLAANSDSWADIDAEDLKRLTGNYRELFDKLGINISKHYSTSASTARKQRKITLKAVDSSPVTRI